MITREALLLSLESLKESSSAFPPLESAVGGVLKLVNTYETMTQNQDDIRNFRVRVDTIQDSLVKVFGSDESYVRHLTTTQHQALEAFDRSIQRIVQDLDDLASTGEGRFRRFVLARRHRSQFLELLARLSDADNDFRRSLELDIHHGVHKIGLMAAAHHSLVEAHHSVVEEHLHAVKTTLAHFESSPDRRVNGIYLSLPDSIGLFAVARS
ncbi:unnamed protein product [Peniophora sp. CBMAI 1063]|nr:unnamed protein product [Peniophora sp. CBMAI 1063]